MGTIFHSDDLFHLAKKAHGRSRDDPSEAIVAVVFAALSFEAFFNESVEIARSCSGSEKDNEVVTAFAGLLDNMENQKAPIDLKIQVSYYVFKTRPLNKGELPYQDFDLLIRLRNTLVHKKPEKWDWPPGDDDIGYAPRTLVKRLADRKVIPLPTSKEPPIMYSLISRPEVARWACNVAAQMAGFLIDLAPAGKFKEQLDWTGKSFVEIL